MDWNIVIQALGLSVTAIFGIASYSSRQSIKKMKEELKLDLEILARLDAESNEQKILRQRIEEFFNTIYVEERQGRFYVYNWDDLFIGGGITALSVYFTIAAMETNNVWSVLAAVFVIVGLAIIPDAFKQEENES